MAKIKYFKVDISNMKEDEQGAIEILKEVGKEIHKIWEMQVSPTTGKISLYDEGITREEIILASETDSEILSPYTVVRRGDDGSLYAVPYTEEYREGIQKIIKLLKEVENVSKDFRFKGYIRNIYKAWEKGDFVASLGEYLKNDNNKIGILMGPLETYADKLMGIKNAFQFNLRVRRDKDTTEAEKMIEISKNLPIVKPYLSVGKLMGEDRVIMRVDDVLMFSGRQAGTMSASTNLPNTAEEVRKFGIRVVVYANSLDYKFAELFSPFLKFITGVGFSFNAKSLKLAASRLIILHEISEGLIKFPDAANRLKGNEGAYSELNAYLMGVKSSSYHMLKGLINQREYEEIILMFLIVGLDKFSRMDSDTSVFEYARGYAVVFNYLEQLGAITVSKKKMKVDISRVSQGVDALATVVLSIFHESKYDESQKLFETYGSFDIAKRMPLIKK
ncbi:hypothetical protein M0R04_01760 [Candidatus Dojkabacteria bacterium]|jgi:hypothetical protein|nr:hypothetical protein [Candidatus Dojkabacteria bacterium]